MDHTSLVWGPLRILKVSINCSHVCLKAKKQVEARVYAPNYIPALKKFGNERIVLRKNAYNPSPGKRQSAVLRKFESYVWFT